MSSTMLKFHMTMCENTGAMTVLVKRLTLDDDGLVDKVEVLNDEGGWEDAHEVRENYMYPAKFLFQVGINQIIKKS